MIDFQKELDSRESSLNSIIAGQFKGIPQDRLVINGLVEIAKALNLQTAYHLFVEEERKRMYSAIPVSVYQPPNFEKLLMEAVEKRDKIREQIEEIERTVDGVPSEMRGFLLATARAPLEGMLEEQEKYISSLQERLEEKGK